MVLSLLSLLLIRSAAALAATLQVGAGIKGDARAIRTRAPAFRDNGSFVDLAPWVRAAFPALRRRGLRNLTAR